MPIRREHRFFYPIDWRELSNVIRFGRAGANVRTFEVESPRPTRDSASLTAAATPSTTGAPISPPRP